MFILHNEQCTFFDLSDTENLEYRYPMIFVNREGKCLLLHNNKNVTINIERINMS